MTAAATPLFRPWPFKLHSGGRSVWKIDADALTQLDWETLAGLIAARFQFRHVEGVPTGGWPLAEALQPWETADDAHPILLVDDVLTTGRSLEEYRAGNFGTAAVIGVVVFARGTCPEWVTPIFMLGEGWREL